jgi:hypothetical protein
VVWVIAIAVIAVFVLIGFAPPTWRAAQWASIAVHAMGWLFVVIYLIGGLVYLFGGGQ